MTRSTTDFPKRVRANLIQRGDSIPRWAKAHGYKVSTVYAALHGQRQRGPITKKIREALGQFATTNEHSV